MENDPSATAINLLTGGRPKLSLFAFLRSRVLTGLFILIPAIVTVWISFFIYDTLTGWAISLATSVPALDAHLEDFWFKQGIRAISVIAMLIIVLITGELARNAIGRRLIKLIQEILMKLPILNTIYSTTSQIGEAFFSSQGGMFRKVVMFEYPYPGCWAVGFVTNENLDKLELDKKTGTEDLISIFMPTTPNPTSGFLIFIPRKKCVFLDMSVADGMRLVISGAAICPGDKNESGMMSSATIEKMNKPKSRS